MDKLESVVVPFFMRSRLAQAALFGVVIAGLAFALVAAEPAAPPVLTRARLPWEVARVKGAPARLAARAHARGGDAARFAIPKSRLMEPLPLPEGLEASLYSK